MGNAMAHAKATAQGHAGGQCKLGVCYYNGQGVARDVVRAAELFAMAAAQGHAGGQCNLGYCYHTGQGIAKDVVRAAELYAKAAAQGHAGGQFKLGVCYYIGEGVARDVVRAAELFAKAAAQGHARGQFQLGFCYDTGQGVANDVVRAAELYAKAATQGHALAQFVLGDCYKNGQGVAKDVVRAAELYAKAAAQGVVRASDTLGDFRRLSAVAVPAIADAGASNIDYGADESADPYWCAICLSTISEANGGPAAAACGAHVFCVDCLRGWVSAARVGTAPSCPTCRLPIQRTAAGVRVNVAIRASLAARLVATAAAQVPHAPPCATVVHWSSLESTDVEKGQGAYGIVRVYRWPARGIMVAVKELKPDALDAMDDGAVASLAAEAELQERFSHPHVVRVYGWAADAAARRYGLVMQLYEGSLATVLRDGMLPLVGRLTLVVQAASGCCTCIPRVSYTATSSPPISCCWAAPPHLQTSARQLRQRVRRQAQALVPKVRARRSSWRPNCMKCVTTNPCTAPPALPTSTRSLAQSFVRPRAPRCLGPVQTHESSSPAPCAAARGRSWSDCRSCRQTCPCCCRSAGRRTVVRAPPCPPSSHDCVQLLPKSRLETPPRLLAQSILR